jgi:hypothetical protein
MRSNTVLTGMVVVMFGSDAVRDVFFFENRFASQVGMAVVAAAAIIGTIVLATMFGRNPGVAADNQDRAEHYVEPVKLS